MVLENVEVNVTSYVVSKGRCPECSKIGKDVTGDNLAIYSDGHHFCYSCKYHFYPNSITSFKRKQRDTSMDKELDKILTLPIDCDITYPERATAWCAKFGITKTDLLNNNVMWSESMQRLIFPIYGDGWLIAWQGRYFGTQGSALTKVPKWYGKGNLKDTFNILGKGNTLILTEDILSAIKVAKCGVMAMPLYGCVVGGVRFKRLITMLEQDTTIKIWLDPDKRTEAVKEAKLGSMFGVKCSPIFSEVDPKEHTIEDIKTILIT